MHKRDKADIENSYTTLSTEAEEKYLKFIAEYVQVLEGRFQHGVAPIDALRFITQNIGRRNVLVINSENDHDNVDVVVTRDLFTFAIAEISFLGDSHSITF